MLIRPLDWWYWLATAALLTAGLFGYPAALWGAIALTALQTPHYAIRTRSVVSFPVQLRLAYLALLLLGLWPPMSFVHWIQFVGTWGNVVVGYCFLARCLSLLPWNRGDYLSPRLIVCTFVRPPVKGSIVGRQ